MNIAIPMLLWCPLCHARHVDAGPFATKVHHTHACQDCGYVWRPAIVHTVGVQFLPGFKDEPRVVDREPPLRLWRCGKVVIVASTAEGAWLGTDALRQVARRGNGKPEDITSYDFIFVVEDTERVVVRLGTSSETSTLTTSEALAQLRPDVPYAIFPPVWATSDNTQLSDVDGPNGGGAEKIGGGPTEDRSARGPQQGIEFLTSELMVARLIVEAYRQLFELAKDACDQLITYEDRQGDAASDASVQLTAWLNNDDFVVKPEQLPPPLDALEPTRAGELLRRLADVSSGDEA